MTALDARIVLTVEVEKSCLFRIVDIPAVGESALRETLTFHTLITVQVPRGRESKRVSVGVHVGERRELCGVYERLSTAVMVTAIHTFAASPATV